MNIFSDIVGGFLDLTGLEKLGTVLGIGGTVFGAYQAREIAKNQAEIARLRAEVEPQLILARANYQSSVLRREAEITRQTADYTNNLRKSVAQFAQRNINTIQDDTQKAINRRTKFTANRIARNNAITEEQRATLFRRLGYAAQDLGEQTGDFLASNRVRQSGSGFSVDSVSFARMKYETRSRLRDRLGRLHEDHEGAARLLLDNNYYSNRNLLEQTYIENEGMIDQATARIQSVREQAYLQDQEMIHRVFQLDNDVIGQLAQAEFTDQFAETQAEFTRQLATLGGYASQSAADTAYLAAAFQSGAQLLDRIS